LGWKEAKTGGSGNKVYNVGHKTMHCGLFELKKGDTQPPAWVTVFQTGDVDGSVKKVEGLGGRIHSAPIDIPHIGRYAIVYDNQSALFGLFKEAAPSASNGTAAEQSNGKKGGKKGTKRGKGDTTAASSSSSSSSTSAAAETRTSKRAKAKK